MSQDDALGSRKDQPVLTGVEEWKDRSDLRMAGVAMLDVKILPCQSGTWWLFERETRAKSGGGRYKKGWKSKEGMNRGKANSL